MQFAWIENSCIVPVIATAYRSKDNHLYFKIPVGDKIEKRCWEYALTLESRSFRSPTSEADTMEMNGNYKLIGLMDNKTKKQKKDIKGNYLYSIAEIPTNVNNQDILLFWVLPTGYRDVTTNFRGDFSIIGEGSNGKMRNSTFYKTPCFIIELTGDTVLTWTGTNVKDIKVQQTIRYLWREKRFDIQSIKEII